MSRYTIFLCVFFRDIQGSSSHHVGASYIGNSCGKMAHTVCNIFLITAKGLSLVPRNECNDWPILSFQKIKETLKKRDATKSKEYAMLGTLLRGDSSARFLRRLSIKPTEAENFIIWSNKRSSARPFGLRRQSRMLRHYVNVGPDMTK